MSPETEKKDKDITFEQCTCKLGSKHRDFNCKFHATPSQLRLMNTHKAAKWLIAQIEKKLNGGDNVTTHQDR